MLNDPLDYVSKIVAILTLLYLSFEDVRSREVPVQPFLVAIVICSLTAFIGPKPGGFKLMLSLIENALAITPLLILVLAKLKGLGDLLAFIVVMVSSPFLGDRFCVFTPSFTTLSYYVFLFSVIAVANLVYVLTRYFDEVNLLRGYEKIIFPFIARPIPVKELIEGRRKWWFPIKVCGKRSLMINVNVEYEDIIREVKSAVERGCISLADRVWAVYGFPAIPLITTAYIMALVVGDKLLVELTSKLLGVAPLCIG